jgi:hypothetical protein
MSIASSHGARELKLPSGEDHRLRFVQPLPPELAATLQTNESSPAYIADKRLREHVAFIAGGILRRLVRGAELTLESPGGRQRVNSKEVRSDIWLSLWVPMEDDCARWLKSIPSDTDRAEAAASAMELVRGELDWSRAKPLYDDGLVSRTARSTLVEPVSRVAAAVILKTVASYVRGQRVSLSSKTGAQRGYELERQLHAAINPCRPQRYLPVKRMNGTPLSTSLMMHSHYAMVFKDLTEISLCDFPVAYLPHASNYPCDAILVPAADDAFSPIVVLEASIRNPLDSKRVAKVRKWFGPRGIVTQLRETFKRDVRCALIWNEALGVSKAGPEAVALSHGMGTDPEKDYEPGTAVGEEVVVIDLDGIVLLNIIP